MPGPLNDFAKARVSADMFARMQAECEEIGCSAPDFVRAAIAEKLERSVQKGELAAAVEPIAVSVNRQRARVEQLIKVQRVTVAQVDMLVKLILGGTSSSFPHEKYRKYAEGVAQSFKTDAAVPKESGFGLDDHKGNGHEVSSIA